MIDTNNNFPLQQIRCSNCGRFLGHACMANGVILILCKNCKGWSVIAEGEIGALLTTQDIYDILPNRGQKVQEPHRTVDQEPRVSCGSFVL